jgi:hypothetical protein
MQGFHFHGQGQRRPNQDRIFDEDAHRNSIQVLNVRRKRRGFDSEKVDEKLQELYPHNKQLSPEQKVKRKRDCEIAKYLRHVKNAWRNPTMHPKRTYTEEEARDILNCVRSFMRELVKVL